MTTPPHRVSLLGLGAMGRALARTLIADGWTVTVWNRTPGRADALVAEGAIEAESLTEAIGASDPVVVCLLDHPSVEQTLTPVGEMLQGGVLINLTTTTPEQARDLARWADSHQVAYLDGAIMATPPMIGGEHAQILYSGSTDVFQAHRPLLDRWATSTFEGADAGTASALDLAMLSGMYAMFAGFLHGAALVRGNGGTATAFADRAAPFLAAMTESLASSAAAVDRHDFTDPEQSLAWTAVALDTIQTASRDVGLAGGPVEGLRQLVAEQIEAGHSADGLERVVDGLHRPGSAPSPRTSDRS